MTSSQLSQNNLLVNFDNEIVSRNMASINTQQLTIVLLHFKHTGQQSMQVVTFLSYTIKYILKDWPKMALASQHSLVGRHCLHVHVYSQELFNFSGYHSPIFIVPEENNCFSKYKDL